MKIGRAVLVINPGDSDEVIVRNGDERLALLSADCARRTGIEAQSLRATILDTAGAHWSKIRVGSKVNFRVDGTIVFSGEVRQPSIDTYGPVAILVEVDAVGRTGILYTEAIRADKTYASQTTGTIGKDIVDTHYAGVLTTTNFTTATGVTPESFEVTEGETIGDVLERLAKLDGYVFEVDENDDVRYYKPSTTSQSTLTEDDLRGDPGTRQLQKGVLPPRNVVRILGGSGYVKRTLQEARDSYYTMDASTKQVAQRFKAATARLSAIDVYLDRTGDPNKPSALQVEVHTDGKNITIQPTTTTSNLTRIDGTNTHGYQVAKVDGDSGIAARITKVKVVVTRNGNPGQLKLHVYSRTAQAGNDVPDAELAGPYDADATIPVGGSTVTYTLPTALTVSPGTKYAFVFTASGMDGSNNYDLAGIGSDAYINGNPGTGTPGSWTPIAGKDLAIEVFVTYDLPSGTKVEWSDDVTITAGDVPYPPGWSGPPSKAWTKPKLALTEGTHYWLILKDASATASKYWRAGYQNATDPFADGYMVVAQVADPGWVSTGKDLTFRLYWTQEDVDVTVTKARSKLSNSMNNSQTTVPVDNVDDFASASASIADRTVKVGSEEITYTGKSVTSGAGNLTGCTRGANATTPASHSSGDDVIAESVKEYGARTYQDKDSRIVTAEDAKTVARIILTKHRDPLTRQTLPLRAARADLTPRAVVTVKRPRLGVNADYEVAEVQHIVDATGVYSVLVLGAREYNAASAIEDLRRRVT